MTEHNRSNCIGFVYYQLGLQETDTSRMPNCLPIHEVELEEVTAEDATVVGILTSATGNIEQVKHLALFDPKNPTQVTHRLLFGVPITTNRLEETIDFYYGNRPGHRVAYFRKRT